MFRSLLALAVLAALSAAPARADDASEFMTRFSGAWLGSGKFLIGSDDGLKFGCELKGDPSRTQLTFAMRGRCWMGKLSAPVWARLRFNAETNRFYGAFLGGAEGDGLDIVAARAGDGFSMHLVRGMAQGRLMAEAVDRDRLEVIVYYRDRSRNRELPVVAMSFARKQVLSRSAAPVE